MEVVSNFILYAAEFTRDSANIQTVFLFLVVLVLAYTVTTYTTVDIPGPLPFPLIGNALNLIGVQKGNRHLYFRQLGDKYGDIYRLYFGRRLVIFLNSYDIINEALVKQSDVFTDRPDFLPRRSGYGIIWSNGIQWKKLRRFSLQTMRDFGVGKKSLEEVIKQEVNGVLEQFELRKGQGFKLKPTLSTAVSNVIHSIVFGCRYSHDDVYFKNILSNFDGLFKLSGALGLSNFYPILKYFKVKDLMKFSGQIREHVEKQIAEHETSFDSDNIRDFVDLYIKQKREEMMDKDIFTEENLLRCIIDLFAAGTETSATTLEWAVLYMIEYPEIQEKCREEIIKVVGDSRMVLLTDRKDLHYINATLCEIQRMSSIVPTGLPHMTAEDCVLRGYRIPKQSVIIAHQGASHKDPRIWDQPDHFSPERFLDERNEFLKSEKLIPFSVGPRICMGESLAKIEIFLFFSNILQRFNFARNNPNDVYNLNGHYGVTTTPISYNVKALPR